MKRNKRLRWLLFVSLICNGVLAMALWGVLLRMGGIKYALYKFRSDQAGMYAHRKSQFAMLPEVQGAIVFLGDSQIQEGCWSEWLGDGLPVLNRGIAGDHVEGVLGRLNEVLRHKPRKIFLMVGVNDLLFARKIPEIASILETIVLRIRLESPSSQIVLHSILPVNNAVKQIGLDNTTVRLANAEIERIAKTNGLAYVNLYAALNDADGNLDARFTDDGLHLNGEAYGIWIHKIEHFLL